MRGEARWYTNGHKDDENLQEPVAEKEDFVQKASSNRLARKTRSEVPLWEKSLLTLDEAAEYTGLGLQKLRDLSNTDTCDFVLWNGTKRMFKRKKLDAYLEAAFSI